jgi:16S rRNA (cytidine1402-2'-O)-methyltransferase
LRRTAKHGSAAKTASGNQAHAGAEPSHRNRSSKPGRIQSIRSDDHAAAGVAATADLQWAPAHELEAGLHLVATPIGNLGDITLRALWVLRGVDRILCEDTRVTARLLARFAIRTPLAAYHDHNADRVRPEMLEALRRGEKLALVSDAGTPLVSDPGFKLVRDALAERLPVTAAPGASASLTALILSGLPPDRFLFGGFLPPRGTARRETLAGLASLDATLIFFEGPSRLAATLSDMAAVLGERDAAVARELTKRHEEIRRDRLAALAAHYRDTGAPRGEAVIVIGPPQAPPAAATAEHVDERLRALLATQSVRDAVAHLAGETGVSRRALYKRALAMQRDDPRSLP